MRSKMANFSRGWEDCSMQWVQQQKSQSLDSPTIKQVSGPLDHTYLKTESNCRLAHLPQLLMTCRWYHNYIINLSQTSSSNLVKSLAVFKTWFWHLPTSELLAGEKLQLCKTSASQLQTSVQQ